MDGELMDIRQKVKEILMNTLDLAEPALDFDAPLITGLGVTSVQLVELLSELENEFDIEIENDDAATMRTANDVVRILEQKAG
jgi:acyl carrier protein